MCEDGGDFVPLDVWRTRGFDPIAIQDKSHHADIKTHPVLGIVYRVRILSTSTAGERGQRRVSEGFGVVNNQGLCTMVGRKQFGDAPAFPNKAAGGG